MDDDRKHEIYERECGYECPCPEDKCPHLLYPDGLCLCDMEEPWFDCTTFMHEHINDIATAENNIELEEEEDAE